MLPRVSILMPVYNVAPYLREAMDSILGQTYGDFELIVLDDCSPDNSEEILDTYSDKRIVRYRGDKNAGLANVLNIGIMMAKGEFIARMDSDDISVPHRLEKQVAFLDAHPEIDLVSSGMQRFGRSKQVTSYATDVEGVKFDAFSFSPVLHASSVWRKDRFISKGIFFRQEMVPTEDYDIWTRALAQRLVLVNIPDVLYLYRTHDAQVTSTHKDWSRVTEIGYNYIRSVFPGIREELVVGIQSLRKLRDPSRVKVICKEFERENDKVHFIKPSYLHRKLKRYYQARLYSQMLSRGIEWKSILELRPAQAVRLITRKIHDKRSNSSV